MVRLQAATVSNRLAPRPRKRKRAQDEAASPVDAEVSSGNEKTGVRIPTKLHDGGEKPRRKEGDGPAPLLRRHSSSTMIETDIPWPEHFLQLQELFRALNLVYTFLCTRKHFATTFENIKSTVESNIKRELLIDDIVQLKTLVPRAINFTYVDEEMLQTAVMGEEDGLKGGRAKDFRRYDEDLLRRTKSTQSKEVLFFEFIDGDLKRQVKDPTSGKTVNPHQKLKNEDLKMPVFSQKQMKRLIEKRNSKFMSAVNEFLNQSRIEEVDPLSELQKIKEQHFPTPSGSRPNTPNLESKAKTPSTIPKDRKLVSQIISELKEQEWYTNQIVPDGHRVFDAQTPIYGDLNFRLSQDLVDALYNTKGITKFYSHQAQAINSLQDGKNVIISTSTSSGKSLIYQVPMLHALEGDQNSRGMYIFPTKALAQDQRRSFKDLLQYIPGFENCLVETFDGDTPMTERNGIREEARIIFTNPDMLHITILPQEDRWRHFLQNLKYVVVDELHVYNGLFGSHMAFIMRRLRRICAAVGNRHVRFVSCSATMANPKVHMETIFGIEDPMLLDYDGSPSGRKEFLCWNTPFKDPNDPTSGRGNAVDEAARLFCELILRGVRVIAFCRVRKQCEALIAAVRTYSQSIARMDVAARTMGYRGGYSAADRRQIEAEMFSGKLMGIVATTALELGIDIGSLDAVLTVGFPYTIANLRQQSGRAGRRNKDSLSMLVGDCFPSDQHYMQNPDEIFTKPNAELQVDLQNPLILEGHLQCAAYEMPIRPDEDKIYFGKQLAEIAEQRLSRDVLGFYHCDERFRPLPSKCVAIRDTEDGHFAVVDITNDRNIVLEEVEPSRAFFTIYEGGIFMHQGHTYLVKEMNPYRKIAKVCRVNVDWVTQQRDFTDIDPIETEAIRRLPAPSLSRAYFGAIRIKAVVFGFFKMDKKRRILDAVEVENPPIIIDSKGMWLDVPKKALQILDSHRLNIAAAIHAAEHAILSLMPNFVISLPGDVRTECKVAIKEFARKESARKRPARLTFYDAKGGAGGSGIAAKAFEFVDLLLEQALERVAACYCTDGCLECICSERCKEANVVISKAGSTVILKCLLGRETEINLDNLPYGEDEITPAGIETVIAAEPVAMRAGARLEEIAIERNAPQIRIKSEDVD